MYCVMRASVPSVYRRYDIATASEVYILHNSQWNALCTVTFTLHHVTPGIEECVEHGR